jgi:hypothetical protein
MVVDVRVKVSEQRQDFVEFWSPGEARRPHHGVQPSDESRAFEALLSVHLTSRRRE